MHEKMRKPERIQSLWISNLRLEDNKMDFMELMSEGME
jgi:hypothetical protein